MKVTCVLKRGGEYHPRHVKALQAMCQQWLPQCPFICLTDYSEIVGCEILPLRHNLTGWWAKMELFDAFEDGETLFFDLDTVVRGSFEVSLQALSGREFVILRDFYRGGKEPRAMQSSVMFWRGSQRWIWEHFVAQGRGEMRGDQDFLEAAFAKAGKTPEFWQDFTEEVVSFKAHVRDAKTPSAAPVVAFHGEPRPWRQRLVTYPYEGPASLDEPCVVVGNGPSVLQAKLGAVIDAFPQVVRINGYCTQGFEAHTGSKTTLHSTHGKHGGRSQERAPGRMLWLHGNAAWESDEYWMVTKDFYWGLVAEWASDKSILPSAGFVTVAWLLEQGVPMVHLAGFDHFQKRRSQLHHYWKPIGMSQPKEHAPDCEEARFAEWARLGRVKYL